MMSSGRWIGVLVFGLAICVCLTLCSLPQILAQKTVAGSCHTEQENQTDDTKLCCGRDVVLPVQNCFFPVVSYQSSFQDPVLPENPALREVSRTAQLLPIPDSPLRSAVLRI